MIKQEEKNSQANRITAVTSELVKTCVSAAKNREEAQASLKVALEIVATFPASPYASLEEEA